MKVKDLVEELSRLLPAAAEDYVEIECCSAPPPGQLPGRDFALTKEVRERWVEVEEQEGTVGEGRFSDLDEAEQARSITREAWVLRWWIDDQIEAEKRAVAEGLTASEWRERQDQLMRSTVRDNDAAEFQKMLREADAAKRAGSADGEGAGE